MDKKVLYHGSKNEIKGFLEPHQATDKAHADNSMNGVYATDRFECAAGMSLTGEQWAFANYNEVDFKVVFVLEPPTPNKTRFVYELPRDSFQSTDSLHQFVSKEKVPIIKTHIFKTDELGKYWRMATPEEQSKQIAERKDLTA